MEAKMLCPICCQGHLTCQAEMFTSEYKGVSAELPLRSRTCDHCGSDSVGASDALANKRAVIGFRKRIDGLLSGIEIRAIRERYGINQKQAALLFGGGPVAFSKYENDDIAQAESMDKLLRLARVNESAFWTLVDEAGLTKELTRHQATTQVWRTSETTNVILVAFGPNGGGFRPSATSARQQFRLEEETVGELRWK
jgi:HTH-type transcriptional regulator/antitoxin MqsA